MSINVVIKVGQKFSVTFADSKMVWQVEVVEPTTETLDPSNWFGRDAQFLSDVQNDGDFAIVRIISKDLNNVSEDWQGSPEVSELPIYGDDQAILIKMESDWCVEFGDFVSAVTLEEKR